MTFGLPSVNEILKGQIYLGNLSAALSPETTKRLGTTHIVSVCPEYPSTGPNHLTIAVDDSEYDNILIHLPGACQFIEAALKSGGRVLVHCVMGISRSATVVAAYLMKTRKISRSAALKLIKQRRPEIHPNYGFITQLETFAECAYLPSPTNPVYYRWKRQQERDVTQFLNQMIDTTTIIPGRLHLSSDFPEDTCQAESLILDSGITHLLSISPAHLPTSALTSLKMHTHIELPPPGADLIHGKSDMLLALPGACRFIAEAIEEGGEVLVHSLAETTACIVVCAFLMSSQGLSDKESFARIQDALPLFNPTKSFFRHLELFAACQYNPTPDDPLVQEWASSETTPTPTPQSGINVNHKGSDDPNHAHGLSGIAADVMSETGVDMGAFADALEAIQRREGVHVYDVGM